MLVCIWICVVSMIMCYMLYHWLYCHAAAAAATTTTTTNNNNDNNNNDINSSNNNNNGPCACS